MDILWASLGTNGAWEANIAASSIGRSKVYLVAAPRLRRCSSKRGVFANGPARRRNPFGALFNAG
jgi:hypothetical protein